MSNIINLCIAKIWQYHEAPPRCSIWQLSLCMNPRSLLPKPSPARKPLHPTQPEKNESFLYKCDMGNGVKLSQKCCKSCNLSRFFPLLYIILPSLFCYPILNVFYLLVIPLSYFSYFLSSIVEITHHDHANMHTMRKR